MFMVLNFGVIMILEQLKDFTRHEEKLSKGFGVLKKEHIIYLFMLLITVYQLVYYQKKNVLNLFGIYLIVPMQYIKV